MEDNINSFVRLMNEKRYSGPFSLVKYNTLTLCKNKALRKCLDILYLDYSRSENNLAKYYLETRVISNRFKQPINCKFYIKSGVETGIRISKLSESIANNLPVQHRNIANNRTLTGAALIPGLFPKPGQKFDPIDPFKVFRRR